jgi:2-iminobutanoate/2-iminopropanoate deaminase
VKREIILTQDAAAPIGPYSQGVRWGNLVFTAGQTGTDPRTGDLVEGGIEAQTRQALKNLAAILDAAGTDLAHALKTTVFLAEMSDFAAMNTVYAEFFPSAPPGRTTVAVKTLPRGGLVEIEVIAVRE